MHETAMAHARRSVADLPPGRVIELGSLNINGSPRILFPAAVEYVGVDLQEGPGVDLVSDILDVPAAAEWDVVVCMEVLEHAPNQAGIIQKAFDLLKPGGVLVLTAATDPRSPHSAVDERPIREWEHYGNLDPADLRRWLAPFASFEVDTSVLGDVYARAVK